MPTVSTPALAVSVAELEAQFAADGFLPGAPPCLSPEARAIDERIARRSRCPRCRRRGRSYQPFHKTDRDTGDCRYRVLVACSCGCAEEM